MLSGHQARPGSLLIISAGLAVLAVLVVSVVVLLVPNPTPPPKPASPDQRALDALQLAQPDDLHGYSPAAFGPGTDPQPDVGPSCTTRDAVLLLAAPDAQQGPHCSPHGTWSTSAGTSTHNPDDLDIDHVVSLPNAWASGADRWNPQQRAAFANDLAHPELNPEPRDLVVAHQTSAGPWTPPAPQARCGYGRNVIAVKTAHHLTVSPPEKAQLARLLDHC